jgi:hypothetical protein
MTEMQVDKCILHLFVAQKLHLQSSIARLPPRPVDWAAEQKKAGANCSGLEASFAGGTS